MRESNQHSVYVEDGVLMRDPSSSAAPRGHVIESRFDLYVTDVYGKPSKLAELKPRRTDHAVYFGPLGLL